MEAAEGVILIAKVQAARAAAGSGGVPTQEDSSLLIATSAGCPDTPALGVPSQLPEQYLRHAEVACQKRDNAGGEGNG